MRVRVKFVATARLLAYFVDQTRYPSPSRLYRFSEVQRLLPNDTTTIETLPHSELVMDVIQGQPSSFRNVET